MLFDTLGLYMKAKKNTHPETHNIQESLAERLNENPFMQWITENPKIFLYAGLLILAFLSIAFRFSSGSWFKSESDYYKAKIDFAALNRTAASNKDPNIADEALASLKAIIGKHPELKAKYNLQIAQILIAQGNFDKSNEFLTSSNSKGKYTEPSLTFYEDYSQATLFIDQGKDQEALKKALSLKESLLNQTIEAQKSDTPKTFGDTLFAYNLLRIAILQQKLGYKKEELNTWKEWISYSSLDKSNQTKLFNPQAFKEIITQLEEKNISLAAYIKAREEKLSS